MKKALPLLFFFVLTLSFCKKADTAKNTTNTSAPTGSVIDTPKRFSPHIDTFAGLFNTSITDGYGVADSMRQSFAYVSYITADSVIITGNTIQVLSYDGNDSKPTDTMATYTSGNLYFSFITDSSGQYYFNGPKYVSFSADSIHIGIMKLREGGQIIETESFAGKKQ